MKRTLRTITLNTGFDDHFLVSAVTWGGVERVQQFRSQPAGKGVNLARTARWLGCDVTAYCLVGEAEAESFVQLLAGEDIAVVVETVPAMTRHNLTLMSAGGQPAAHMVAEGFQLSDPDEAVALLDRAIEETREGDVVSLNGSVPKGLPESIWASAALRLAERDAIVLVDAQGKHLVQALETGAVFAAKPNESEMLVLPGVADAAPHDQVAVSLKVLAEYGVQTPMVTAGVGGVFWLDGERIIQQTCLVAEPQISVGAGDAFLAGFAVALVRGADRQEAIRTGLASASTHVAGIGRERFAHSVQQASRRVSNAVVQPAGSSTRKR